MLQVLECHQNELQSTQQKLEADIQQREQTEIQLKASELRLKTMFEGARDGVLLANVETRCFVDANPAICSMLGYSRDELLKLRVSDIHPAAELGRVIDTFKKQSNSELNVAENLPVLRKDGTIFLADISVAPILLDGVRHSTGFFRDVTERNLIDEERRKSAYRYKTLLDSLPQVIWQKDASGHYVTCNKAYANALNLRPDQLEGMTDHDIYPSELANKYMQDDIKTVETRTITRFDESWLKNGEERFVHTTKIPLIDEQGQVYGTLGIADDVTEQRKTNLKLERFRNLVDQSRDAIYLVNPEDGQFVDANRAGYENYGYSYEEILKMTVSDIETTLSSKAAYDQFMSEFTQVGSQLTEGVHRRKDGSTLQVEVALRLLELDKNQYVIAVARDISARKRTETQLLKFSQVIAQSPESIVITNLNNEIEYVNDAFVQCTGYQRKEVMGCNPRILKSGHTSDETYQALWATLKRGETWKGEFCNQRKDGSEYIEFAIVSPIKQKDGSISHYVAVKEDITERKRLSKELDNHRNHLEQLVSERTQELEQANCELSRHAERQSTLLKLSDATQEMSEKEMFDFALDEAERLTDSQIGYLHLVNDDQDTIQFFTWSHKTKTGCNAIFDEHYPISKAGIWADAIRSRRPVIHNDYSAEQTKYGLPEGHVHLLRHMSIPVIEEGKVKLVLGVGNKRTSYNDNDMAHIQLIGDGIWKIISRRRMINELEKARRSAEQAAVAKSQFLANMSHEIRTPMNAVLGFTNVLKSEISDPIQLKRLDKIDLAGHHLLSIINDILDLSKIEAGKLELLMEHFSLADLFDQVQGLVYDLAKQKGLNLKFDLEHSPNWLYGDPTRLRQALINYIGNAIKFTHQGFVWIRVRLEQEDETGYFMRFEVEDTGIGIKAESLSAVFKAFEQTDVSSTRQHGGTGLGLTITNHIAKMMQGETGVQSVYGKGSTFWFTAHLGRGNSEEYRKKTTLSAAKAQLTERVTPAHILLVEDNVINQEVAVDLLNKVGLRVECANDGQQALEKVHNGHYDLILMDIHMPNMDGLDATRSIRQFPEGQNIPILAMTANAFNEDRDKCLAAGMNDFVPKPINLDQLYSALAHWLPKDVLQSGSASLERAEHHFDDAFEHFSALPGVNTERSLKLVSGNQSKLISLLHRFMDSHRNDPKQIGDYVTAEQFKEAHHLAHSIKGSAATLGLDSVSNDALELERAIKERLDTELILKALDNLRQAIERTDQALPKPDDSKQQPSIDLKKKSALFEELEPLLRRNDASVLELYRSNAQLLQTLCGEEYTALANAIERFEFDDAMDVLKRIR